MSRFKFQGGTVTDYRDEHEANMASGTTSKMVVHWMDGKKLTAYVKGTRTILETNTMLASRQDGSVEIIPLQNVRHIYLTELPLDKPSETA